MSFWSWNPFELEGRAAEELGNLPSGSRVSVWLLGVFLPLFPVAYAVYCLFQGEAYLPGRGSGLHLHGSAAVAAAMAYGSIGLLLHFHWFWGSFPRLALWSGPLKILALLAMIVALGRVFWLVF